MYSNADLVIPYPTRTVFNNEMKTNQVISNYPNNTAPGKLNSIKRTTQLLNLNLNTCYRSNYYLTSSSNYQYIFPTIINNVVSLRLASIEFPNSWYLFSHKYKNTVFIIETNNNGDLSHYNIVIPEGDYTSDQLVSFLNNQYFYTSTAVSYLKYIKFSIDPFSSRSQFELVNVPSSLSSLSFNLHFLESDAQNLQNSAGWIFGFRLPNYLNVNNIIISEGLFDSTGNNYVYFSLNDYQNNCNKTNIVFFSESILDDYILAKIPIINGKLSLSIYDNDNPLNKVRYYNGPINLNRIHVKLYDRFGNIIDLNNMDYGFTLEVEMLYENFNFSNINK
jgi:hypothetical protein